MSFSPPRLTLPHLGTQAAQSVFQVSHIVCQCPLEIERRVLPTPAFSFIPNYKPSSTPTHKTDGCRKKGKCGIRHNLPLHTQFHFGLPDLYHTAIYIFTIFDDMTTTFISCILLLRCWLLNFCQIVSIRRKRTIL